MTSSSLRLLLFNKTVAIAEETDNGTNYNSVDGCEVENMSILIEEWFGGHMPPESVVDLRTQQYAPGGIIDGRLIS